MRRVPFSQMVIGLDKMFFGTQLGGMHATSLQADAIDQYLVNCGWDWDSVIEYMCNEQDLNNPNRASN
jgi:hypothetical protein